MPRGPLCSSRCSVFPLRAAIRSSLLSSSPNPHSRRLRFFSLLSTPRPQSHPQPTWGGASDVRWSAPPLQGGRGAPAGRFVQLPGPEEAAAAPADLRQLRPGRAERGRVPGCASCAPLPGAARASGPGPPSGPGNLSPARCLLWLTGLLSPSGGAVVSGRPHVPVGTGHWKGCCQGPRLARGLLEPEIPPPPPPPITPSPVR